MHLTVSDITRVGVSREKWQKFLDSQISNQKNGEQNSNGNKQKYVKIKHSLAASDQKNIDEQKRSDERWDYNAKCNNEEHEMAIV